MVESHPAERQTYRLLFLGGSDVTFSDTGPSGSQVELARAELVGRHPDVEWVIDSKLLYPSADMVERARHYLNDFRPDVVHLLLGANTFIEETAMFSIRRKFPRLYPAASRLIALGKRAGGGGAEGSASARGLLFRLPRSLARAVVGTATYLDADVARTATLALLDALHDAGIAAVCRLAGGGVQQRDQRARAAVVAGAYNDAVREHCRQLAVPCWRLVDDMGDSYGWTEDRLHADLASRTFAGKRIADFTEQCLGLSPRA